MITEQLEIIFHLSKPFFFR